MNASVQNRTMRAAELIVQDFAPFADIVRAHAAERPEAEAIVDERERLDWRTFDARIDRVAARLQADGIGKVMKRDLRALV